MFNDKRRPCPQGGGLGHGTNKHGLVGVVEAASRTLHGPRPNMLLCTDKKVSRPISQQMARKRFHLQTRLFGLHVVLQRDTRHRLKPICELSLERFPSRMWSLHGRPNDRQVGSLLCMVMHRPWPCPPCGMRYKGMGGGIPHG